MYRDIYNIVAQYLGPIYTLKCLDRLSKGAYGLVSKQDRKLLRTLYKMPKDLRFNYACRKGSISYIMYFAAYCNFHVNGALECLKVRNLEAIEWLINNKYITKDNGQIVMEEACRYGYDTLVFKLIELRTPINVTKLIYNSSIGGSLVLVKYFWSYLRVKDLEYLNRTSILEQSVEYGNYQVTMWLLDHGINMKINHVKLMVKAAWANSLDLVKYFHAMGVQGTLGLEWSLHAACYNNNIAMVEFLLEGGANLHYNDDMPLVYAIRGQSVDVLEYLETQGCSLKKYIAHKGMPYGVKISPEFKEYMILKDAYTAARSHKRCHIIIMLVIVLAILLCLSSVIIPPIIASIYIKKQ